MTARQTSERTAQTQAEICMVARMLQVMENAWLRMRLGEFSEHPLNRGWMNVFRRWTDSDIFNRHWAALRGQFSQEFVQFCKNELKLVVYDIFPKRISTKDITCFGAYIR